MVSAVAEVLPEAVPVEELPADDELCVLPVLSSLSEFLSYPEILCQRFIAVRFCYDLVDSVLQ